MKTGCVKFFMNGIVFFIGIAFVSISLYNYFFERSALEDILSSVKCNTVNITLPSGVSFEFKAQEEDRKIAWEIFVQIRTRIAAVEFKDGEDSLLHVNQSLYDLFNLIREKVQGLSLRTVTKDKDGNLVELYFSILNHGIRPYLTKWHIPVSHFHTKQKDSYKSTIEVDQEFAQSNPKIILDIKSLNYRMKKYAEILHKIARGIDISESINFTQSRQENLIGNPSNNTIASQSEPQIPK